jgi:DNA mismatch repair protein MutS
MTPQPIAMETGDHPAHSLQQAPEATQFQSILFPHGASVAEIDACREPEFFLDLNLDQVVASATTGRDEYNLKPFFYAPASDIATVHYRQDAFRDIRNRQVFTSIRSFASSMQAIRAYLLQSDKHFYKREAQKWFLDGVERYCSAVTQLMRDLNSAAVLSEGLRGFCVFLARYVHSSEFRALEAAARTILTDLDAITYSLHIAGKRITVTRYEDQSNYGAEVLETFMKFQQSGPRAYKFRFSSTPDMNHVEAAIVDMVAQLYPDIFSALDDFWEHNKDFLNPTLTRFDREVQFYVAWIEYIQPLMNSGLSFCYPVVSQESRDISASDIFDIALAEKLLRDRTPVVTNEFSIRNPERIIVVSGPNQGGKTTFARTFGQLHYLAALGCPVAAKEAYLFLFDRLFTHFEREEDVRTLSGKLEDELMRIHRILEYATSRSILVMNESFLSTTLNDALFLSREVMRLIIELDLLCVSVTFLDELSTVGSTTVSMVSTVDPSDPARRTFKVVRKSADGLAYALAIAEKYGLTYETVRMQIARNTGENHS